MNVDELLKAVDNLSEPDLDNLVSRALFVRVRRNTNVLTAAETDLLLEINQVIPVQVHDRYEILLEKPNDETLTEADYRELLDRGRFYPGYCKLLRVLDLDPKDNCLG